jgi:hypothetical protein
MPIQLFLVWRNARELAKCAAQFGVRAAVWKYQIVALQQLDRINHEWPGQCFMQGRKAFVPPTPITYREY